MSKQLEPLVAYLRELGAGKYFPGLSAQHISEFGYPEPVPGDDPALAPAERAGRFLALLTDAIEQLPTSHRIVLENYYQQSGAAYERSRSADDELRRAGRAGSKERTRQVRRSSLEALARYLLSEPDTTDRVLGTVLTDPVDVYSRAAEEIAAICGRDDITIEIASLYGRAGRNPPPAAEYASKVEAACVAHILAGGRVRRVTSFVSETELDEELARQAQLRGSGVPKLRYELSAYPYETPPVLSPLVVGNRYAFLGLEDSQFAGFFRSMKLDTPSAVAFCKEHFDMLWDNDDAVMLTNAVGVVDAGVAELRRRLTKLTH